MNDFGKLNRIRDEAGRSMPIISNKSEVSGSSGFKSLHVLWLYPDILNLHGGRGDVMGILHICDMLDIAVDIRRWDNMNENIPWDWPDMVFMGSGELKCAGDVAGALRRQEDELEGFVRRGGFIIAVASSGAVLAESVRMIDGSLVRGLGLLGMRWSERESVWGDDIWFKTEGGDEVIGNQIQVADVELDGGQSPLGTLVYGRGNNGGSDEGARSGNVIFTNCLGPLVTKNPEFAAGLLVEAAANAGIAAGRKIEPQDIETEIKSAEYIKRFMRGKMSV